MKVKDGLPCHPVDIEDEPVAVIGDSPFFRQFSGDIDDMPQNGQVSGGNFIKTFNVFPGHD